MTEIRTIERVAEGLISTVTGAFFGPRAGALPGSTLCTVSSPGGAAAVGRAGAALPAVFMISS